MLQASLERWELESRGQSSFDGNCRSAGGVLGVETCTRIGRVSELGRSSQGRRCRGWAGGQSASSRQSPGTEGRGRTVPGGAGQRGSGGHEGGPPAQAGAEPGQETGLPCPPTREGGEAGVHLRAGVYSRRIALAALSGRGQCFRARRGGLSIPADAGSPRTDTGTIGVASLGATTGLERRDLEEDV